MSEEINDTAPVEATVETPTVAESATVEAPPEASPIEEVKPAPVEFGTSVSEEYKDLVATKGFQSTDDALKAYVNLEAMVGNSVRIPSDDASPEAKNEFLNKIKDIEGILIKDSDDFYTKLGRPETSDAYKFEIEQTRVNQVPGLSEDLAEFQTKAHELGLTQEQASALVDMRIQGMTQSEESLIAERDASVDALKKTWGNDYDNRLKGVATVLENLKGQYGDALTELVESPAGNNVAFLQMTSELAAMYAEKGHKGLSKADFGMTPELAHAKISEKRADSGFMSAYGDPFHAGHKTAVTEMTKLYQLASGVSGK